MRAATLPAALGRPAPPCACPRPALRRRVLAVATPDKPAVPAPAALQRRSSDGGGAPARLAFRDEEGQIIKPMPADYGFRSGSGRLYQRDYGTIPTNVLELSLDNFRRELRALRRAVRFDELSAVAGEAAARAPGMEPRPLSRLGAAAGQAVRRVFARLDSWLEEKNVLNELTEAPMDAQEGALTAEQREVLAKVRALTLDDDKVIAREKARLAAEGRPKAPLVIQIAFTSLCWAMDVLYAQRPIERFWLLETVARMPYFVYISMLHLYESLGWWRAGAELRKVHFAEEWNELHHLQIMESLGGDRRWVDRFLAEHAAVFYYWACVLIYLASPSASYQFMELVEGHAADTYAEFAEQNEALLRTIPPPLVALNYYKSGDLYLFDMFQTSWKANGELRRPTCNNLYDVFINIRDDELEHFKTVVACQDGSLALDLQNMRDLEEFASEQGVASLPPWSSCDLEDAAEEAEAGGAAQLPPGGGGKK